jgi:hypothetical protein
MYRLCPSCPIPSPALPSYLSYLFVPPILSDISLPCLSSSRFLLSTAPEIRQTIRSGLHFVCSLGPSPSRHLRRHTCITRHPICHRLLVQCRSCQALSFRHIKKETDVEWNLIVTRRSRSLCYLSQKSNSARLHCSTYPLRGIIWFPVSCLYTPCWIITTSCTSLSPPRPNFSRR